MHLEVLHEADRRRRMIKTLTGRRPSRRARMPRQQPATSVERGYFGDILGVLDLTQRKVEREVLPKLAAWIREGKISRGEHLDAELGDAVDDVFDRLAREIVGGLTVDVLGPRIRSRGRATAEHQGRQLRRQLASVLGVEVPFRDRRLGPMLDAWTSENVRLIRSIPRRYLDQVESKVRLGVDQGKRHETIAQELLERFKVSRSSAHLIARDQVGKFYGNLNRARQTELGVESYIWQTSNDNRVRDEHEARSGDSFRWDSPPEDGHPGIPINCRCYADPDLSGII